jgi:transposase-like protein
MALELDHYCPVCGEDHTFWRAASMTLHLGEKTKWRCPECNYGFVRIDGDIDSSDTDVEA